MIVPEGKQDEDGFAEICSSWCSIPIRCSPAPEEADVYILTNRHSSALLSKLASRSASLDCFGTKPVIVLCEDLLSVHTLQSSKSVVNISPRIGTLPILMRWFLVSRKRRCNGHQRSSACKTSKSTAEVELSRHRGRHQGSKPLTCRRQKPYQFYLLMTTASI